MATPSLLEFEQKMSAMIRTMWGEIRDEFKELIYLTFGADINAEGDNITYKENCAKWFCILTFYGQGKDDDKIESDKGHLRWLLFNKQIDPDTDKIWLLQMQMHLPELFMDKVEHTGFSTVPRTAVMSGASKGYKTKSKEIRSIYGG